MAFKKTGDGGNGGGSAPSDMDDFVFNKWLPFAGDQGWVANQAPTPGSAPNREIWSHRGTVPSPEAPFAYMRTKDDAVFLMTGTDIDLGGEEIFDQPGNPANGPDSTAFNSDWTINQPAGLRCPVVNNADGTWSNHYLFAPSDGSYIHAVCQVSAREWRHFHYGLLNKFGTWTGGSYVFGHFWNQQTATIISDPYAVSHTAPFGGVANQNLSSGPQKNGFLHCEGLWATGANNVVVWGMSTTANIGPVVVAGKNVGGVNNSNYDMGRIYCAAYGQGMGGGLWEMDKSLLANAVALVPIHVFGFFTFNSQSSWCVLGTIPDVFRINMKDFTPGDEITIGADTFRVFPTVNSDVVNTVQGDEYSGYEGLAYKVIT